MPIFLIALVALNVLIAWWNAKVIGLMWYDRAYAGPFMKLVLASTFVQSVIGFSSMFILAGLGGFYAVWPEGGTIAFNFGMNFWYVLVILPLLGTGLSLTIHSWIEFVRKPSIANGVATAWNTFAQFCNTTDALSNIDGAIDVVWHGIGALATPDSDDNLKSGAARIAIGAALAIVTLGILGAVYLTLQIVEANKRPMAKFQKRRLQPAS